MTTPTHNTSKAAPDGESAAGLFCHVIYAYSRADALADGYLIDVTAVARTAGFRAPVAIARAAWEDCVAWTDADSARKHWPQDQGGRLWDVLTMTRFYMRGAVRSDPDCDRFMLQVLRVPRSGRGTKARAVSLLAVVGGDDEGAPCTTIGHVGDF